MFLVAYGGHSTWCILQPASDREIRTGYIRTPFKCLKKDGPPGELLM